MKAQWEGGGEAEVVELAGVRVTMLSTRPFPPGAPVRGTLDTDPPRALALKVAGSVREGERYRVRARLVGATVELLALLRGPG